MKRTGRTGAGRGSGERPANGAARREAKAPVTLPDPAGVAARLLALCPPGELPALWKETELKRRIQPAERPLISAALTRLQGERQVLALTEGKKVFYLFAGALRGWLENAPLMAEDAPPPFIPPAEPTNLFDTYARLVRQSGGFPDVRIAALRAALDPVSAAGLSAQLADLWRAGRATLSQGDWSLADEPTRAAAVLLHGESYLLVRLE